MDHWYTCKCAHRERKGEEEGGGRPVKKKTGRKCSNKSRKEPREIIQPKSPHSKVFSWSLN